MTWIKNRGGDLVNLNRCTVIRIAAHGSDPNKWVVKADNVELIIGNIEACETFLERLGSTLNAEETKHLSDEKPPIGSGKVHHAPVTLGKR